MARTDKQLAKLFTDVSQQTFVSVVIKLGNVISECAARFTALSGKEIKLTEGELLFAFQILIKPEHAFPGKFAIQTTLTAAARDLVDEMDNVALDVLEDKTPTGNLVPAAERYLELLNKWEAREIMEEIMHKSKLIEVYEKTQLPENMKQTLKDGLKRMNEWFAERSLLDQLEALLEFDDVSVEAYKNSLERLESWVN